MMKYKGFFGKVEYFPEWRIFRGQILGISYPLFFQGKNPDELEESFHSVVDVYLEKCKKTGEKPEKVYSGKFNLRIDPLLHAKLAMKAEQLGLSMNQYIALKLEYDDLYASMNKEGCNG